MIRQAKYIAPEINSDNFYLLYYIGVKKNMALQNIFYRFMTRYYNCEFDGKFIFKFEVIFSGCFVLFILFECERKILETRSDVIRILYINIL